MTKFLLGAALVALALPASAATLTSSTTDPFTGAGPAGGLRLRAFDLEPPASPQREFFLGRHDLGQGAPNRVERDLTYSASNSFTLNYDKITDTLSGSVNGNALSFANFQGGLSSAFAGKNLNRLTFQLRDGSAGQLTLSNLLVNGVSFDGVSSANGLVNYTAVGNFSNSFSVSGTLGLVGPFTAGAEGDRLQVLVGNAVPEPATWAMMVGGFGFVGAAMRRRQAPRAALA